MHGQTTLILHSVETIERGPVWVELFQPPAVIPRLVHTSVGTGLIINVARGKLFGLFGIGQRWLEGNTTVGRIIRIAGVLPYLVSAERVEKCLSLYAASTR